MEVFHLIPEKKHKLVSLVLQSTYVSVKTLQRLVGKCTSFSQAVPEARYSQGKWMQPFLRAFALNSRFCYVVLWERRCPIGYSWRLGITHYLGGMNDIFKCQWLRMHLSQDGGLLSAIRREVFEYWSGEQLTWDVATKKRWQSITYFGFEIKCATHDSMRWWIIRRLSMHGMTKGEGVFLLIMPWRFYLRPWLN